MANSITWENAREIGIAMLGLADESMRIYATKTETARKLEELTNLVISAPVCSRIAKIEGIEIRPKSQTNGAASAWAHEINGKIEDIDDRLSEVETQLINLWDRLENAGAIPK